MEPQRRQQEDLTGQRAAAAAPGATQARRSRPWRAIISCLLAGASAVAVELGGVQLGLTPAQEAARANTFVSVATGHIIQVAGTIAFFVFGLIFTFSFARWAQAILEPAIGIAYAAILRYVLILGGVCAVILVTLNMLSFNVQQLVVGGAITGVLISIAAQQSLANLFAGVMLQFARPFRVGDRVRVRSGALAGTIEGTVTEFSITYVQLDTDDGGVFVPNAQVLAAAVSPVRLSDSPGSVS